MAERINLLTIALPTTNGIVNLDFIRGSVTYIVGPNGSGKSSLLTFATRNAGSINHKRILAYRQISFGNDQIDITAQNRRQMDNELNNTDMRERIRWMDDYSQVRISNALYDLVHSENNWNKEIATLLRSGKHEEAERKSKQDSPIAILNDVLAIGALPVRISISDDDRILAAHGVNLLYGINRMSDGERNAVLLAAELLTAKANSLIIIDEPERHLHRSITVPILAALFQRRSDCSFLISTHDVELPSSNPNSTVIIVRDCTWVSNETSSWDISILEAGADIPSDTKQDILGSRRKVLFVEGKGHSLDLGIYSILFPDVTVSPKGSCSEIEKIVKGIKGSSDLHWVTAYGLVDRDDRTDEQVAKLVSNHIHALERFSVESLYYSNIAIAALAKRQLTVLGQKLGKSAGEVASRAEEAGIQALVNGADKERQCARRYERKLRSLLVAQFPSWGEIEGNTVGEINITVKYNLNEEYELYQKLLDCKDWDGLVARYPLRETNALKAVIRELRFASKDDYEAAVRKAALDDVTTKNELRELVGSLARLL